MGDRIQYEHADKSVSANPNIWGELRSAMANLR
jgi:hypothetical protein